MIYGEKVYLRPLEENDAKETLILRYDLEAISNLLGYIFPINIDKEKEWIRSLYSIGFREKIYFAICSKINNNFLGYLSLQNINYINKTGEFGIILKKEERGKGFAKEAMELFFNYLQNILGIRKISLRVLEDNVSAIKLYEKMGFFYEGKLIKQIYINNSFKDLLIMGKFLEAKQ